MEKKKEEDKGQEESGDDCVKCLLIQHAVLLSSSGLIKDFRARH